MLPEIAADEFAAALDACVEGILWEADVRCPPIDALVVAERLGMAVAMDIGLPERARFVRLADGRGQLYGQATIVVGPAERPEREQWAVAHEIGESLAYRVFNSLGVAADAAPPASRELVANHLANCLLLPRRWFAADGPALEWDLLELKQRYASASHELIARRVLEMPPPVVMTVCDLGRITWRRSNVGARPAPMLPQELALWRDVHASGLAASATPDPCSTGFESLRGWPVHEPGWKREILCGQIAEW